MGFNADFRSCKSTVAAGRVWYWTMRCDAAMPSLFLFGAIYDRDRIGRQAITKLLSHLQKMAHLSLNLNYWLDKLKRQWVVLCSVIKFRHLERMISSVKELGKERRHFLFTRSHHPRANIQDMKCKSCDKECLQNCSILGMTVWTLESSPKWTCHNNSSYFPTEQMWDGRSWLCCHFPSRRLEHVVSWERSGGRGGKRHDTFI